MFASDTEDAVEKYTLVVALESSPAETRRPALRRVAERWPGALREAELVAPDEMVARGVAAQGLAAGAARRGGSQAREAVVLWQALHRLLHDQRALRLEREGAYEDVTVERLVARDTARVLREGGASRWPKAGHLRALTGEKVRPRQAYLWLAAQAGLTLAGLHAKLFLRAGRWDLRADDPPWSRDPSFSG